jgi:hypothetical protein
MALLTRYVKSVTAEGWPVFFAAILYPYEILTNYCKTDDSFVAGQIAGMIFAYFIEYLSQKKQ